MHTYLCILGGMAQSLPPPKKEIRENWCFEQKLAFVKIYRETHYDSSLIFRFYLCMHARPQTDRGFKHFLIGLSTSAQVKPGNEVSTCAK